MVDPIAPGIRSATVTLTPVSKLKRREQSREYTRGGRAHQTSPIAPHSFDFTGLPVDVARGDLGVLQSESARYSGVVDFATIVCCEEKVCAT
jgi:hypothetical protein